MSNEEAREAAERELKATGNKLADDYFNQEFFDEMSPESITGIRFFIETAMVFALRSDREAREGYWEGAFKSLSEQCDAMYEDLQEAKKDDLSALLVELAEEGIFRLLDYLGPEQEKEVGGKGWYVEYLTDKKHSTTGQRIAMCTEYYPNPFSAVKAAARAAREEEEG